MTARLKALCALIDSTDSFIDVGCDHGYVVKYVVDNRLARVVTACDISPKSLEKARTLLCGDERVNFVCADGAVAAAGHDTVLVSGMGGDEILSIMSGIKPREFILSPQSQVPKVRLSLLRADYDIVYDRVIRDGKFYDVIKAKRGGGLLMLGKTDSVRLEYGMFADEKNDALAAKVAKVCAELKKYPDTADNLRKIRQAEEVIKWQLR